MPDRAGSPTGSQGSNWHRWLLVGGLVLLVLLMALNSQKVRVHLIFTTVEMPLIFALLIAALLGAAVGWAVPRLQGPRRQ